MKAAVIFLGAPGSGKGTQSRYLKEKYAIPILGMGDLLRSEAKKSDVLSSFLDKGKIVPWFLTRQIFEKNIGALLKKNIVILDGVPRNLEQALDIDQILHERGFDVIKVVHLDVSTSSIQHRLSHRLICANCQAPFSNENYSECPFCACPKYHVRTDDNLESIQNRIDFHKKNMQKVLTYYKKKQSLLEVDANQSIQKVQESIGQYIAPLL